MRAFGETSCVFMGETVMGETMSLPVCVCPSQSRHKKFTSDEAQEVTETAVHTSLRNAALQPGLKADVSSSAKVIIAVQFA
mmetsp:Transcript_7001/g.17004  ORF Transcript_7001/g.17004 Transcript_7001/m.17004 type:complete len:81 (+) Transcript_7001:778-1020(+)